MRTAKQTGSSLVEVMVALFVLAIGLLGILALQSKSMQYNQSAHIYSQAIYLANDIAERIRSNPTVASEYLIAADAEVPEGVDCTTSGCSPSDLAKWDKIKLHDNVTAALPAGAVVITQPDPAAARLFRIEISFDDSRSEGIARTSEEDTTGQKTYALMVEI
jgi:type IV pilus modification protein PilV